MTNYASMAKRIRSCKSSDEFARADRSLDRLYNAGIFSVSEYSRLTVLIMEREARSAA